MTESLLAKTGMSLLLVLFGAVFLLSLRGILFPYEWELVVKDDYIRWGKVGSLTRQSKVELPSLKRLIYDRSNNKVLADTGGWRLAPLGDYIIMKPQDQSELVDYLRKKLPGLEVETT